MSFAPPPPPPPTGHGRFFHFIVGDLVLPFEVLTKHLFLLSRVFLWGWGKVATKHDIF